MTLRDEVEDVVIEALERGVVFTRDLEIVFDDWQDLARIHGGPRFNVAGVRLHFVAGDLLDLRDDPEFRPCH